MGKDIESFMKREFGSKGLRLLNDLYEKVGVDDIAAGTDDQKKKFVAELQPEFRQKSLTRADFLTSEIMSIIGLREVGERSVDFLNINKYYIKNFIDVEGYNKIKATYAKIEAIFNLFWVNAGEAYEKGVSIKIIHQITQQILESVRQDLFSICGELEEKFNIGKARKGFFSRKATFEFIGSKMQMLDEDDETPIEKAFEEFKGSVNHSYKKFCKVFMASLDKDIALKEKGITDKDLREQTKNETREIWDEILRAYDILKYKIDRLSDMESEGQKKENEES